MLRKLTTDHRKPIWINLDMIVKMESVGVEDGYPSTQLLMFVGGSANVYESPEEIAAMANFAGSEDDLLDDGALEDRH